MKKANIFMIGCIALISASFIAPPNTLIGRWQHQSPSGNITLINFRANGSYDVFINGKALVNGQYYVRQDTVGITDASCGANYYAKYKADFYAPDSLRFVVIQDTCRGRREGSVRMRLGRVKTNKP